MRPKMTSLNSVLSRIREIEVRLGPPTGRSDGASSFVDVLQEEEREVSYSPKRDGRVAEDLRSTQSQDTVSLRGRRPGISENLSFQDHLKRLSREYGVDGDLVRAVMNAESGGNPRARSPKGATGLMQLMPSTARMLGVDDPWDPVQNLEGGIKYLSQLTDKYKGDLKKVLAAYNAGPSRVDACGGIPPFAETRRYVRNVLALYDRYSRSD